MENLEVGNSSCADGGPTELMMERLNAMNVAPIVVDLTQEEDEGGLGGPIFLAPETPTVSVDSEEERA